MQTTLPMAGQMGLERAVRSRPELPRERPLGDPELTDSFVRAKAAWARWRERQKWQGR